MKKKLPWLKYDMKKLEFINIQEEEKSFKKKMEEAAKIWQDAKAPIEYVSQSKGSSSVIIFLHLQITLYMFLEVSSTAWIGVFPGVLLLISLLC
jgi:hypothetical protein